MSNLKSEMEKLAQWGKENPMPKLPQPIDQSALIRELVGALDGVLSSVIEDADDCVQTHSETAERIRAARVALSRVPAEYLERDNG